VVLVREGRARALGEGLAAVRARGMGMIRWEGEVGGEGEDGGGGGRFCEGQVV
jgi:hypothetical protein